LRCLVDSGHRLGGSLDLKPPYLLPSLTVGLNRGRRSGLTPQILTMPTARAGQEIEPEVIIGGIEHGRRLRVTVGAHRGQSHGIMPAQEGL
jgi:hypothetical protein